MEDRIRKTVICLLKQEFLERIRKRKYWKDNSWEFAITDQKNRSDSGTKWIPCKILKRDLHLYRSLKNFR